MSLFKHDFTVSSFGQISIFGFTFGSEDFKANHTELVAPKLVTANNHFASVSLMEDGENEKIPIFLSILCLFVSCEFVFVGSISVSLCFFIKSRNSLFS